MEIDKGGNMDVIATLIFLFVMRYFGASVTEALLACILMDMWAINHKLTEIGDR